MENLAPRTVLALDKRIMQRLYCTRTISDFWTLELAGTRELQNPGTQRGFGDSSPGNRLGSNQEAEGRDRAARGKYESDLKFSPRTISRSQG